MRQIRVNSLIGTELITIDDVKLYAKIDTSVDDSLITNMISQARIWCENYISRDIISKNRTYYMDETNTTSYGGFDVLNLRFGYTLKRTELWLNVLNLTNAYYSTMATKNFSVKGTSAYSYYLGDPRSITVGWRWHIIK